MLLRAAAFTVIAAVLAAPAAFAADKPLTKADVEKIIGEYIDKNPQIIMDSVKKYQQQQQEAQQKNAEAAIKEKKKEIFFGPNTPFAGNPKADIVVAEFFDYHCGYCKKSLPAITKLLEKNPKIKVVFHEMPILSQDSELAARAAIAVFKVKPDKYFAYHTAVMGMQGAYTEEKLLSEAKKLGIDEDKVKKQISSDEVSKEIQTTAALARSLNINGTPAFIVGETLVPGAAPYEELQKLVDAAKK